MSSNADIIIIAVQYDESNKYITKIKCYKRDGDLLTDLKEASREGIINAVESGRVVATAIKNPLSGLWHKQSLVNIYNGFIKSAECFKEQDQLEGLPKF